MAIVNDFPTVKDSVKYYYNQPLDFVDVMTTIAFALNLVYYLTIIKKLFFFFKPRNLFNSLNIMVLVLFLFIALVSGCSVMSIINRDLQLMGITGTLLTLVVIFITLSAQTYTEFLEGFKDAVAESKPNLDALAGVDIDEVKSKLTNLINVNSS